MKSVVLGLPSQGRKTNVLQIPSVVTFQSGWMSKSAETMLPIRWEPRGILTLFNVYLFCNWLTEARSFALKCHLSGQHVLFSIAKRKKVPFGKCSHLVNLVKMTFYKLAIIQIAPAGYKLSGSALLYRLDWNNKAAEPIVYQELVSAFSNYILELLGIPKG